jgi:hypothetical protein
MDPFVSGHTDKSRRCFKFHGTFQKPKIIPDVHTHTQRFPAITIENWPEKYKQSESTGYVYTWPQVAIQEMQTGNT